PEVSAPIRRVLLIVRDHLVTAANSFGIWRDYPRRPTVDPDAFLSLEDLSNSHNISPESLPPAMSVPEPLEDEHATYWPFSNAMIQKLMAWLNNGQTAKSEAELDKLIHDVVLSPGFKVEDLISFSAHRENQRLDKALSKSLLRSQSDKALSKSLLRSQSSETSVDILVPSGNARIPAQKFSVPGLLHRKLTSVIRDTFNDPLSHLYHLSPFKLFHRSPITQKEERIYGEVYTSDAFLEEHEKVQQYSRPPLDDPECKCEKVVAALMFSSDATHLTDFRNAKVWPIYLMLGNLSKYFRSQPNSGAMHHLAYIPSVRQLAFWS
ncbi:hypothetical protein BDZ97DRAFT_1668171, partial [Flammula alnicola]